jgi:hypothetical protein
MLLPMLPLTPCRFFAFATPLMPPCHFAAARHDYCRHYATPFLLAIFAADADAAIAAWRA